MDGVSGVGSTGYFQYDLQTKRLSATDGDDEFVRYFNDDDTDAASSLNGYDRRTKGAMKNAIDRVQEFYRAGLMEHPIATDGETQVAVSYEISGVDEVSVSVGGNRLTMVAPMVYLPDEIKSFSTVAPPFRTTTHKDYDPTDNSIHLAVGDTFSYGNGYRFTVGTNAVQGSGYDGKSEAENAAADRFMLALDSLIHFGDGQYLSSMIDRDMTPEILRFLREQGVDTDREFIVNETRCEVRDGRICEVGNKTGVPNAVYEKALSRYEASLAMPLA